MSNEIARRRNAAVTLPKLQAPPYSSPLWWAVEHVTNPHPDIGAPKEFHPRVKREASAHLALLDPMMDQVTPALFGAWLRPILSACRNPPEGDTTDGLLTLLYRGFFSYPTGVFTLETQSEAIRVGTYRPSGGDIAAILEPAVRELRQRATTLRYITEAADTPEHPPAREDVPEIPKAPAFEAQEPVRTVAEQLKALGFDA